MQKIYEQILKECFWEYSFSAYDIKEIVLSSNFKEQQFLFEKILANSTSLLDNMTIFSKEQLKKLIDAYKVPSFNYDYLARRKNMIEFYFLDKPLTINELKWVA